MIEQNKKEKKMRIPDLDTREAIRTTNLILRELRSKPPRIGDLENKLDRKAAIQTTNLILRELDPDRLQRKQMRDQ